MITNREKKLRGTALTLYKETLSKQGLSQIQKDILIGTLLGDASMQAMKGNQEFNVKFEQVTRQIDYINHLYEHFHDWVGTPPQVRNIKGGNAADRQSIWFKTYKHPSFAFYKNIFYKVDEQGKQYKVVPKLIHRWLTPRALAYWFMDDGSVKRNKEKKIENVVFNTQGFSYPDQILLAKALGNNFQLEVNLWKDKTSWKLAVLATSRNRFLEIISPYILPSFEYKIATQTQTSLLSCNSSGGFTCDVDLSHPGAEEGPKG